MVLIICLIVFILSLLFLDIRRFRITWPGGHKSEVEVKSQKNKPNFVRRISVMADGEEISTEEVSPFSIEEIGKISPPIYTNDKGISRAIFRRHWLVKIKKARRTAMSTKL